MTCTSYLLEMKTIYICILFNKISSEECALLKMQNKSIYYKFLKIFQLLSVNYGSLSAFDIGVEIRMIFLNILIKFVSEG